MSGTAAMPDGDVDWLRHAWTDEPSDEDGAIGQGAKWNRSPDPAVLLAPLAAAQDALARLEASAAAASAAVQEGLRARIALREAAGWLAHHGSWIHPTDLALREAGLGGSYTAAAAPAGWPFGSAPPRRPPSR
jgi:hypothetical protein